MKRNGTYKILLLLILTINGVAVIAQTFKAGVDRDKILIGEQIHLTLRAEGIKASQDFIKKWIDIPDTLNHLEVVERGTIDTIEVSRDIIYQQTITLTSFDSGQWQIPGFKLAVENNVGNATVLSTQPITINVLPVDVSQLKDYHDIKDILEAGNGNTTWILLVVIALTLVSLLAIYIYSKRKSAFIPLAEPVKGIQSPLDWALSALNKLQQQDLAGKGQIKQYYLQLTHICRQYFQMKLQQKALQQTTDEWMLNLQPLPVQPPVKTSFFQFIRLADAVKFAKYLPPVHEYEQSMQAAKQMIIEVADLRFAIPSINKTNLP